MSQEEKHAKPKKAHAFGLPCMSDARQVTTGPDSGVARSVGGVDSRPAFASSLANAGPSRKTALPASLPTGLSPKSVVATEQGEVPFGWRFKDVPMLPQFHPLEMTAVFVPHASPHDVAQNISEVLRSESIMTTFDDRKAKVKCMTEENVDFRVRLYRGRGKFSHGIIVEVQRRFGHSVNFHGVTLSILDAAKGKITKIQPKVLLPVVSDKGTDDETETRSIAGSKRKSVSTSSFSIASDMLKRSRTVDSNILAMETLASITDHSRIGKATALQSAKQILCTGPEEHTLSPVIALISEDTVDGFEVGDPELPRLRILAMAVLCNSVEAIYKFEESSSPKDQAVQFCKSFVPVLVSEIENAQASPIMATLASRALKFLVLMAGTTSDMKAILLECNANKALQQAKEVGTKLNVNLEKESSSCLEVV